MMNMWTTMIKELLGVDLYMALAVQDAMEEWDFDFSECTIAEFNRSARMAYDIVSMEVAA